MTCQGVEGGSKVEAVSKAGLEAARKMWGRAQNP
jgi:hypothetical protein